MSNKSGVSLIEFCIYLLLLALVVTLSFKWLAHITGPGVKKQTEVVTLIDLHLARDLMVADISKGSKEYKEWVIEPSRIRWKAGNLDICWECRDEKLFRTTGKYQPKAGQWADKKSAVVMQGVTALVPTITQTHNGVVAVSVVIKGNSSECTATAFPLAGRKIA